MWKEGQPRICRLGNYLSEQPSWYARPCMLVLSPVNAKWRICQHKVELLAVEFIVGQSVALEYLLVKVLGISLDE